MRFIRKSKLAQKLSKLRANRKARIGECSWSQEGEDRLLSSLLFKINGGVHKRHGFYIDVGAHHPYRYSNTWLFYQRGWSGINIDPLPGVMNYFDAVRPRDINLELGIARESGILRYHSFDEPAFNTFDPALALARDGVCATLKNIREISVKPLSQVLDQHLIGKPEIDFLTIDVEGLDLEVLMSNDWGGYRPGVILIEIIGSDLNEIRNSETAIYLFQLGYELVAKTVNTSFFVDSITYSK